MNDVSMISPAFVRAMGAYNHEMNQRIYAAAARLSDEVRRRDAGAFWRSIHGTLSHLVWGDEIWLSRFVGTAKPNAGIKQSADYIASFEELQARRPSLDQVILDWGENVTQDWLDGDIVWFSGAVNREVRRPRAIAVAHFFNHQTHHRGQVHAMITAAGEQTGDTDLFLLV